MNKKDSHIFRYILEGYNLIHVKVDMLVCTTYHFNMLCNLPSFKLSKRGHPYYRRVYIRVDNTLDIGDFELIFGQDKVHEYIAAYYSRLKQLSYKNNYE